MSRIASIGLRTVFAAGVAAALALGTTQVLRAAIPAPERNICSLRCEEDCIQRGYHTGVCDRYGRCICYNY